MKKVVNVVVAAGLFGLLYLSLNAPFDDTPGCVSKEEAMRAFVPVCHD